MVTRDSSRGGEESELGSPGQGAPVAWGRPPCLGVSPTMVVLGWKESGLQRRNASETLPRGSWEVEVEVDQAESRAWDALLGL